MRQLRYIDYDCPSCDAICTRFVYFDTETHKPLEEETCQAIIYEDVDGGPEWCGGVLVPRDMAEFRGYVQGINKNNSDYNERERTRLEKRQDDHWKRQGRDEAIDRERAFLKKQGAIGGVR